MLRCLSILMKKTSLVILKQVAKKTQIPLLNLIKHNKSIEEQFPLALLIDADYVGLTTFVPIMRQDPDNAHSIKALHLAQKFNKYKEDFENGKQSKNEPDPQQAMVFIKAKGLLYLEKKENKRMERIIIPSITFLLGILVTFVSQWLSKMLL